MFGSFARRLLFVILMTLLPLAIILPVAAAPTPCADLAITAFSTTPSSPIAGHPAQIDVTVQNQGTCSTNTSFVVQWKQTQFSATGPSTSIGPLSAGASATAHLSYTFPSAGNFMSQVNVDTQHAVSETNEVNNLAIYAVTVQKATTDLIVASFSVDPNPAGQGLNTTATIWVYNNGNTDAGQFVVAWRPTLATPPLTQTVSGLAANSYTSVYFTYNYPDLGDSTSMATADATSLVSETNEFNNSSFANVVVEPALSDLSVSQVTFNPASPIAGQNVHVTVTVQNTGHVSTGANFAVQWKPSPFSAGLSQQIGPLAAGASTDVGFDYIYQNAGTFTSTATADVNNVITELHEDNNSLDAPVTVQGANVDLTINSVTVSPSTPTQGQTTTVTVNISNNGNDDAGPFVVSWNPDANGLITPGPGTLTQQVNSLGAGQSMDVTFTFSYPQAGAFHTVANVDAFNTVSETNETNNLAIKDFSVNPGNIDLVIDSFSVSPSNPKRFDTVTATVTVRNAGSLPVGGFFVQWKTVSTNTSGSVKYVAGLNPGETATLTFKGMYFTANTYTSEAIVDVYNQITEPGGGESNNAAFYTVHVQPLS
jgi:subtilase family serine protease